MDFADIRSKLKVSCERCTTIFYVLGDTLECPKCGNMIDQHYRFNKHNGSKDESDYYDELGGDEDVDEEVGGDGALDDLEGL